MMRLFALLPVLQEGLENAYRALQHEEESRKDDRGTDAYTGQLFGEALAAFDASISKDDHEGREKLQALRDGMQEALGNQVRSTAQAASDSRVQEWLWDHQQRKRWIKEELTRRNLLPSFPAKR